MNRQSMFDTGYRMLGAGALGLSREMIWGGREIYVYIWLTPLFLLLLLLFFFKFYFILLYNTVLVLPYIDMNLPRVYMSSQS